MSSISEATTKFALDFFKVLNKDHPSDNIIYSPLSISAALGMVLLGARGNTATQIQKLEKELTYEKLTTWISPDHLKEDEVDVALPRFKVETSAQLKQYLEALGMTDVFHPGASDLSGMAKEGGLFVSEAVHKAYIEVNEEGTVAAAATGIGIHTISLRIPVQFVADHPFLFFIRHQKTKCILFYGRVSSP
uniref:Serpin domain-containing protein n=1 Tax=Terrapene triunguis TaxID=2587831 RepID=A0A674IWE4_9SAUR